MNSNEVDIELRKFFALYREKFLPVYADLVVLTAIKPKQVLIEESNILSHISQIFNQSLPIQKRKENLIKSNNHLLRATLDCHKIVWAELKKRVEPIVRLDRGSLIFNLPEEELLRKYNGFIKLARQARRCELESIGDNPYRAADIYEKANEIGFELYEHIDNNKLAKLVKLTRKKWIASIIIAFVVGLFTDAIWELIKILFQF